MGGIDGEKIQITIEPVDIVLAKNSELWFWIVADKAAKELGVTPFCPCGERPHRIHCPLGFDNYFPPGERAVGAVKP
jgi:hypothetical protein